MTANLIGYENIVLNKIVTQQFQCSFA